MSKDLKGPNQQPAEATRGRQLEEPARVYTDLLSGKICSDNFEPLPNDAVEDPAVKITTARLSNTSKKPSIIGVQKQA